MSLHSLVDKNGNTLLHLAVIMNTTLVEPLLRLGLNIHKKNSYGLSAHMMLKNSGAICSNCNKYKSGENCSNCNKYKSGELVVVEGDKSNLNDFFDKVHNHLKNSGHPNIKREELNKLMKFFK